MNGRLHRFQSSVVATAIAAAVTASAQPLVTRGPYLQTLTTSNVIVRWRTSEPVVSAVRFGLASNQLPWAVAGEDESTEHLLTLTNLAPGTRYFYAVGTPDVTLAGGADFYFRTAPTGRPPVRVWVIGCSGSANQPGYEGQAAAVRDAYYGQAGARDTDVWLALGDNAYMNGTDQEFQESLFDVYPSMLRRCALWPVIGNHDLGVSGDFPYADIFSLPASAQAGGVPSGTLRYYSFDYGNIHFVCLDSQSSDRTRSGAMLTWLEQDLAANTNDWLIACWHGPPYSFGTHNSDNRYDNGYGTDMRENAVPILEAHGVDLVFGAHSHNYERTFLLDGLYSTANTLTPAMLKDSGSGRPGHTGAYRKAGTGPAPRQGAVYVVCGSSGWLNGNAGTTQHPAMFTEMSRLGSMMLEVNSNRLDAFFIRETGAIDDSFTILKGAAPEPLRAVSFQRQANTIRLKWKSVAGRRYQVQRTPAVASKTWEPVGTTVLASGATTGWTNTVQTLSPAFYRVSEAQ